MFVGCKIQLLALCVSIAAMSNTFYWWWNASNQARAENGNVTQNRKEGKYFPDIIKFKLNEWRSKLNNTRLQPTPTHWNSNEIKIIAAMKQKGNSMKAKIVEQTHIDSISTYCIDVVITSNGVRCVSCVVIVKWAKLHVPVVTEPAMRSYV